MQNKFTLRGTQHSALIFTQHLSFDSQCPPRAFCCIAPLDEGEGRLPIFPRRDLKARDAAGMNAGAGIVIGTIGMNKRGRFYFSQKKNRTVPFYSFFVVIKYPPSETSLCKIPSFHLYLHRQWSWNPQNQWID